MRSTASRWPLAVRNRLTTDRRCSSFIAPSYPTWGGVRLVAPGHSGRGPGGRSKERTPGSQSEAAAVPPLVDWEISVNLRSLLYTPPFWLRAALDGEPVEVPEPPSESSDRMGLHRRGRALGILLLLVGADIAPSVLVALIAPVSPLALVANRVAAISGVPAFDHIFTIVMENTSGSSIIGNTAEAPYLNSLATQYGATTNYAAISHPSLPNYLALTAGSTLGVTDDCNGCFQAGP